MGIGESSVRYGSRAICGSVRRPGRGGEATAPAPRASPRFPAGRAGPMSSSVGAEASGFGVEIFKLYGAMRRDEKNKWQCGFLFSGKSSHSETGQG